MLGANSVYTLQKNQSLINNYMGRYSGSTFNGPVSTGGGAAISAPMSIYGPAVGGGSPGPSQPFLQMPQSAPPWMMSPATPTGPNSAYGAPPPTAPMFAPSSAPAPGGFAAPPQPMGSPFGGPAPGSPPISGPISQHAQIQSPTIINNYNVNNNIFIGNTFNNTTNTNNINSNNRNFAAFGNNFGQQYNNSFNRLGVNYGQQYMPQFQAPPPGGHQGPPAMAGGPMMPMNNPYSAGMSPVMAQNNNMFTFQPNALRGDDLLSKYYGEHYGMFGANMRF